MEIKYYLPKLKELHIYNFDLYKCPLDIQFSSRLNLVFGTNGLGKTTLLNILQYAIIGPYTGKVKSRNWKDQQKLKRPMLDKNYFRNRMSNQSQQAEVKVVYSLGNDLYEVWHYWYRYNPEYTGEGTVIIFHKHRFSHPYHQHGRTNTLRQREGLRAMISGR